MTWPADVEGWIQVLSFVPIVVCSIVGLGLALAKWFETRAADAADEHMLVEVRTLIMRGDHVTALELSQVDASRASRIVTALLRQAGGSREALKDRAAHVGAQIARELEYGLGGLALIAGLGPLFGLLGTVIGIVIIFEDLNASGGLATPQQLAGGIGTALYTTVFGLIVGILALVSHRYLSSRVDRMLTGLKAVALDMVELVCGDIR
jgi:biopolymer transport protein ExbB